MSKQSVPLRGKMKLTRRKIGAMETQNEIRKAALELFSKHSFNDVTIDDITTLAGVSKGSFYTHFTSKESVLVDEFRNIDSAYIKLMETIDPEMATIEKLLLLVREMCTYISQVVDVNFMKIVYSSQIADSKSISILNNKDRKLYQYVKELMQEGVERKELILHADLETSVRWFLRCSWGLIYDWCLYDGDFDVVEEGQRFFKSILKSISI